MSLANPLVWRAIVFSITAIALVGFGTWWFYWSPLTPPVTVRRPPSKHLASWLAMLLALSGLLLIIGGLWDGSMHIKTGKIPAGADFLWPPHLMIYGSFLLAFAIAEVAIAVIALPSWRRGVRDPRRWVRGNPYLGAVALASIYQLLAIPGDALWHEIIGIDLTAWSPPHVLIGMMAAAVTLSAIGLLVQARPAMRAVGWANRGIMVLLLLQLKQIQLIGVSEWEWPFDLAHLERPIWLYPVVGGGLTFFILILAKQLVPHRWTATTLALMYYVMHFSIALGMQFTDNVVPAFPLLFILGALVLDVMASHRIRSGNSQNLITAAAFTAGYELLALPLLTYRTNLAPFDIIDIGLAIALMFLSCLGLRPAAHLTAQYLVGRAQNMPLASPGQPIELEANIASIGISNAVLTPHRD